MPEPPFLDYQRPPSDVARISAALFWSSYALCLILGLSVLEPMLATALWGHPGDQGVTFFVLSSAVTVSAVTMVCWRRIRRLQPNHGIAVAILVGLCSFVPGYVTMYVLFP